MSLPSRVRAAVKAFLDAAPGAVATSSVIGHQSRRVSRETPEFLKAYGELPPLRVNTDIVSEGAAAARWHVYKGATKAGRRSAGELASMPRHLRPREVRALVRAGDLKEAPESPLAAFLAAGVTDPLGAVILTGLQVRKLTTTYRILAGESFALLERNAMDLPVEQVPWPPHMVTETPEPGGPAIFKVLTRAGAERPRESKDILWRRILNPLDPYGRGVGPARSVATELETDESMGQYGLDTFFNGARPELLVTGAFGGAKEAGRHERAWQAKLRGKGRSHQAHFMDVGSDERGSPGQLNVVDLSRTMEDMQVGPLRAAQWDMIRQVLSRSPAELLGVTAQSNRATVDAARYVFGQTMLVPLLEDERAFLLARVVPEFGGGLLVEYDSPVDEDWDYILQVATQAPYSRSVDEWRELQGLPLWGGDEGARRPVPLGVNLVSDLGEDPYALGFGRKRSAAPPIRKSRAHEAIDAVAAKMAPRLRAQFLAAVEAAKGRLELSALEADLAAGRIDAAIARLGLRELAASVGRVEVLRATLEEAGRRAASTLARQVGADVAFEAAHRDVARWLDTRGGELAKWLRDSGEAAARDTIEQEMGEAGRTAKEAAAALQERLGLSARDARAVGNGDATAADRLADRARRFGGGQSYSAANEGQRQAWGQAAETGAIRRDASRVWITRGDGGVCERCDPMDGQRRGLGDPFNSAGAPGSSYMNPGDPHADWTTECRCFVVLEAVAG
jgi:hypothetical protein